jgi:hypothetical protein
MNSVRWRAAAACVASVCLAASTAGAEVVDVVRTVSASGSIGSVASLTVTPLNIVGSGAPASVAFGSVSLSPGQFWKVAPTYLRVQHQSNSANWAIRILTNNKSTHPTMTGAVLDPKTAGTDQDDILGYGGLIGSNPQDPNDRVPWAWQVYKDTVVGGPTSPTDAQVGGTFNIPWAFLADASDCPATATNCRSVTPSTLDKTIEFLRVAQGDAAAGFLKLHPDDGNRIADGDVAVYIAARFGGAPADSYGSSLILELYHF